MRHRCPHGAEVRAGEPRRASPSVCPVHGPALEPERLWVQGGEWGGSLGLSCPRDPRPSSCESLGRTGKGAFSRPAPTSTAEPACSCWGWARQGCGQAGALRFGSSRHKSSPDRGAFQGSDRSSFYSRLAAAAAAQRVPSLVCGQGAPQGLSVGGHVPGHVGSQGWVLPLPAALPRSPGTRPCPSRAGTPCDRHPALAPGPALWAAVGGMAAHEQRVGDGRACPIPGRAVQGVASPAAGEERAHSGLARSSGWGGSAG